VIRSMDLFGDNNVWNTLKSDFKEMEALIKCS
jgi:hypothetical protein